MRIPVALIAESQSRANPNQTDAYLTFRSSIPRSMDEDVHLCHIQRLYMVRAMQKRGEDDICALRQQVVGVKKIRVDVTVGKPRICTLIQDTFT